MIESPGLRGARLVLLALVPILALAVVHMATGPWRAQVQAEAAVTVDTLSDLDAAQRAAMVEDLAQAEGAPGVVALDRIWMVATLAIAGILGATLPPALSAMAATNGISAIGAGIALGLWMTDRASLYDAGDWRLIAASVVLATGLHLLRRRRHR